MRADRLVATLLLLQARGSVTAREVAEELEVSERTARRDLDALAVSGVPIYSVRGRGGGWRLIGGASTDLTGLRSPEARALMTMVAATSGSTPELRTAMAKLTQAMPEPVRAQAEAVLAATINDDRPWGRTADTNTDGASTDRASTDGAGGAAWPEWLVPLQEAVLARRPIELGYARPNRAATVRRVEPLGLVHKRGVWYVVGATDAGDRTFRVDRVRSVEMLDERFDPPADFDLEATWNEMNAGYVERGSRIAVEAVIDDEVIGPFRTMGLGVEVRGSATPHPVTREERSHATLASWNLVALVAQIAGSIERIELVDPPPEVTEALVDVGQRLVDRFG